VKIGLQRKKGVSNMVIGRVFRGIGNIAGRIHGTVFRALGRLPLVGGVFKAVGNLSAGAVGLLGKLSPLSMLGLGSYDPSSSFLGGFSEASLATQNGYPPTQQMAGGFNNMYGPPQYGGGGGCYGGGYNNVNINFGSPFGSYGQQSNCCCCCGYRGF
jgi:hypothetical protein